MHLDRQTCLLGLVLLTSLLSSSDATPGKTAPRAKATNSKSKPYDLNLRPAPLAFRHLHVNPLDTELVDESFDTLLQLTRTQDHDFDPECIRSTLANIKSRTAQVSPLPMALILHGTLTYDNPVKAYEKAKDVASIFDTALDLVHTRLSLIESRGLGDMPSLLREERKKISRISQSSGDTDTSPLTLIEFQGDLAAEQADLSGLTIGTLKFSQTRDKVTLRVGLHLLEGRVVKLSRPLAVLERPLPPASRPEGMDGESRGEQVSSVLRVHQFIREKMIFSTRPIPILGTPSRESEPAATPLPEGQMDLVANVLKKSLEGVNSSFSKVHGVLASSMQQSVALAQNVGSIMEQLLRMNLIIDNDVVQMDMPGGEQDLNASPSLKLIIRISNTGTIPIPGITAAISFHSLPDSKEPKTNESKARRRKGRRCGCTDHHVDVKVSSVRWVSPSNHPSQSSTPSTLLWSVGGSSLPSTSSEEITITMPPHSTLESTGKALCVDKKFGLYLLDQASRRILTPSSEEEVAAHAPGWGVDVGGEEGPIRVSLESLRHLFSFQPARGMRPGDCMMCQWILGNGNSNPASLVLILSTISPLGKTGELRVRARELPDTFAQAILRELEILVGATISSST
ncbi:MAG: hypothetical protein DHS80DRAFT_28884 [Piptocephalis tieghemiana]|nr:MAG: hypothetical protein DHS80DRAFT_28884 [Piptocephalis tieghemiana]